MIPAFNEEKTLDLVIAKMDSAWDIIVVDDGSIDDTAGVAHSAGAQVVRHDRNQGYDAALASGLNFVRKAGYRIAVTIDADGQIPADVVKLAVERIDGGADMVLGRRAQAARWAERIFAAYGRYRYGVADILCGMKAYRLACFKSIAHFSMNGSIGTALALTGLRMGLHWVEVDVPIRDRRDGSRFGSGLRANWRILQGMWAAMLTDFRRL